MKLFKLPLIAAFLLACAPAYAQNGLMPTGQASLSVSGTTSNVALPNSATTLLLFNDGSNELFFNLGGSSVVATTNNYPIPAGSCIAYSIGPNTSYVAAITSTSTTTLRITQGRGIPGGSCGGSSGGGTTTVSNSSFGATSSAAITNPTSTLTLPSTTTAYTAGNLICTSATVATCNTGLASTSFAIANSAGGAIIPRLRLSTSDTTSTAWGSQTIQVDLWSAAPTFATTGDRASFITDFSTGTANHLGAYTCLMGSELGDGAYAECAPNVGTFSLPKLASGTSVYWTATAVTGSGVTGASKVFTLTAEVLN